MDTPTHTGIHAGEALRQGTHRQGDRVALLWDQRTGVGAGPGPVDGPAAPSSSDRARPAHSLTDLAAPKAVDLVAYRRATRLPGRAAAAMPSTRSRLIWPAHAPAFAASPWSQARQPARGGFKVPTAGGPRRPGTRRTAVKAVAQLVYPGIACARARVRSPARCLRRAGVLNVGFSPVGSTRAPAERRRGPQS